MEKRFLSPVCGGIELRFAPGVPAEGADAADAGATPAVAVVGYAAKFNVRSQVMVDSEGMQFVETFLPGAFDAVLGDDVVALFNHDPNMPLARTTAGTLALSVDDIGLRYEFDLADDDCSEQVASFIGDGRVSGSSFGFVVAPGGDNWAREADGVIVRSVSRLSRVYDVSPVTYPAYLQTGAELRSAAFTSASTAIAEARAAEARTASAARARELELLRLSLG